MVQAGSQITFLDLLTLVFIALKLMGDVDWSWWWVMSPMLGKMAFVFVVTFTDAYYRNKEHL